MDIYRKPTDAKRYVTFKWNDSKHCLKNIPFSLAHRICMITEKEKKKETKYKEYLLPQLLNFSIIDKNHVKLKNFESNEKSHKICQIY